METTETNTEQTVPTTTPELVRPLQGRIVAGVAKGLAVRYGIAEWIVRLVFIVTSFTGGLGLALYGAGWLLIRSENEAEAPAARMFKQDVSPGAWIGLGLVGLAALIVIDRMSIVSGTALWTVALIVLGVLLYTGQIRLPGGSSDDGGDHPTPPKGEPMTTDTRLVNPPGDAGGATPPQPPPPAPTPPILPPAASVPKERSILGRLTIGCVLVGLGILAVFDNVPGLFGVYVDPRPRHYLALAITIMGIGLIVGAFVGRARWLILVVALLMPTLLFSPFFNRLWVSGDITLRETPTTFAEVDDTYSAEVGRIVLDLTQLPWDGEDLTVDVRLNVGNIEVIVPNGVAVTGTASISVGAIDIEQEKVSAGIGDRDIEIDLPGNRGTLHLFARTDVGAVSVHREGTVGEALASLELPETLRTLEGASR